MHVCSMFTFCFPEIHLHTEGGKNNLIKNNLLTSYNDSLEIIWKFFYKQIALDDKIPFYYYIIVTLLLL